MTIYAVTRHTGALQWLSDQGVQYDRHLLHFKGQHLQSLKAGDLVIGTLPVAIASQVCAAGAEYWNIVLPLTAHSRTGMELGAEDMRQAGAKLERYHIEHRPEQVLKHD